jgi:hypothetical protein
MTDYYPPSSQAWVDEGFAFLTINYRGSTTFGRALLEQIWGDLGRWEVDTTDTLRGVRAARFGDTPQEQPDRYAASSPITYTKNVRPRCSSSGVATIRERHAGPSTYTKRR